MKLLVALSIKEYQEQVAHLLRDAGVEKFSVMDITGYKNREENLGWFAANADNTKTNSILLFSFTANEIAEKAIVLIDSRNAETKSPFPLHAFVLDVDNFSKFI